MGNRAVITFDKKPTKKSVGIYLHWNGGPESVLAFLEAANQFGVRDDTDQPYQLARFIQIIANYFGGTTSIGVGLLEDLDCDNGNNGVYRVSRKGGVITIDHNPTGTLKTWITLEHAAIKKHQYWQPDDKGHTIMTQVLENNTKHFERE
jgi:hypothetical protein